MKKLFITLNKLFFKFQSFMFAIIAIFLIQFVYAQGWLKNKSDHSLNFGWFVIILGLFLFINWIYNSKFYSFCNINEITPFDVSLYGGAFVSIVTWLLFKCIGLSSYVNSIWFLLFLIFVVLIFTRLCLITKNESKQNDNNLIELKNLNTVLSWTVEKGPLLVNERAASYDLLDRSNIEKLLLNAIKASSLKHSYVIGIVGEWGSGKTTLLNLVKRDSEAKQLIFMQSPGNRSGDFDIWLFGSQWALIKGLYDIILNSLGVHYYSFLNERFVNSISEVAVGVPKYGSIVSALLKDNQTYQDINELKTKLSDYILSTGKHYILCIDNLDRANNDQVILLLKLISTVFDLPHITYVLLYSERRMNKILNETTGVNNSYLDKVVNLEIEMPRDLNRQKCKLWLQNLLLTYKIPAKNINSYDFILDFIVNNINDIRELKRVINSTFAIMAISKTLRLNLPQVLAIQYIYFSNSGLYEEIQFHENMFTFEDDTILFSFETKELNDEEKKYFEDILEKYNQYRNLLMELFPKFKKYIQKNSYQENQLEIKTNIKKASINTRRYFKNYFYLSEDNHVKTNACVQSFIIKVNSGKNIRQAWIENFINVNPNVREKLLAELDLFVDPDDIPISRLREKLAEILLKDYVDKENNVNLSDLDKFHLEGIISKLIGEVNKKEFDRFENQIKDKYGALKLISYMNKSLNERLGGRSYNLNSNSKRMIKLYNNILRRIFEEKINLFDNEYYESGNATVLYEFMHEKNINISRYLNVVANKDNVYRILFDVIATVSNSHGKRGYSFNKTSLDYIEFYKVPELVNLLDNNSVKTESQRKVLKVLKAYFQEKKGLVYFEKPIDEANL